MTKPKGTQTGGNLEGGVGSPFSVDAPEMRGSAVQWAEEVEVEVRADNEVVGEDEGRYQFHLAILVGAQGTVSVYGEVGKVHDVYCQKRGDVYYWKGGSCEWRRGGLGAPRIDASREVQETGGGEGWSRRGHRGG